MNDEFHAPWWLPGHHLQTIVPAFWPSLPHVSYVRERWDTPDGDFIDVDRAAPGSESRPMLVVFHGLESSSAAAYARRLVAGAVDRGWQAVVPHFRGCGGSFNRLPRFYHSGDSAEADWILRRLAAEGPSSLHAVGVSLGGNVLLKWLGEQSGAASAFVSRAAAISAPMDLAAGGESLAQGLNRAYGVNFLRTLKAKGRAKLLQYPGLFDRARMEAATDLRGFDDAVTAPVHGFAGFLDYYRRSSSKPLLPGIAVPTLILNARNDPFMPAAALPSAAAVSRTVTLHFPATGGHVGFARRGPDGFDWMARRVLQFLAR